MTIPFVGFEDLHVVEDGYVRDDRGFVVGYATYSDWDELIGPHVDEDGDVVDDNASMVGHASFRHGDELAPFKGFEGLKVVARGTVEDEHGFIAGYVADGDPNKLLGCAVGEDGLIVDKDGYVIGHAEFWDERPFGHEARAAAFYEATGNEPPFTGFRNLYVIEGGSVQDIVGTVVGRVMGGGIERLIGRSVDTFGYIVDSGGDVIGRAWPRETISKRKLRRIRRRLTELDSSASHVMMLIKDVTRSYQSA